MSTEGGKGPRKPAKGAFYRLMRDWHGYFSAAAFLALIFFAGTGILLNHPELLPGPGVPYVEETVQLSPEELDAAKTAADPGPVIVDFVSEDMKLIGAYQAADAAGSDVFIRMQGLRGTTDMRANMDSGSVEVTVAGENAIQVINGLHRGELTPMAWKLVIDIVAVVLIVMAVLGYILFFSLRFRLKTALVVTGVSLVAMAGVFFLFVP